LPPSWVPAGEIPPADLKKMMLAERKLRQEIDAQPSRFSEKEQEEYLNFFCHLDEHYGSAIDPLIPAKPSLHEKRRLKSPGRVFIMRLNGQAGTPISELREVPNK
jgi:hypothetical protein